MSTPIPNAAELAARLCSISSPLDGFPAPVGYINMKTGVVKSRDTLKRQPAPGSWLPFNTQDEVHELLRTQAARIAELEAEVAEWRKLRDPVTLHANLIRGLPARLDRDTFLHIAGDGAALAQQVPAVPEGWHVKEQNGVFLVTAPNNAAGAVVYEFPTHARTIPEEVLWLLLRDLTAAAPLPTPEKPA
jgi:hypothetical protein